ncbi:Tetratricopeptide repeat protein [Microbulbifer aggregans]|uniref:Tetratricopeptide repeat protein n=1 Tax=Microbulbifer aggregans TaxID=1769779 RepID=A0A1C9W7E3_9GAMM|nr:tetratricopeptide repeat protein [Microbulbifer aggregans]AOS97069.1 Tetratricopeptide repeat protein [Microbulbifer aggregans]
MFERLVSAPAIMNRSAGTVLRSLAPVVVPMMLAAPAAAVDRSEDALRDLFFGAAMYEAHQEEFFDAIVTLDTELNQYRRLDEPELDPFSAHFGQAQFSVGDLELSYRMHREAGRAIEAVLKGNVPQPVKNEAAYRLAKIHYHKQQPRNALHALEMIEGQVPERVRPEEQFLRARVYMELGRFEEAVALLRDLKGESRLEGFVEFNLGIALLKSGDAERGVRELTALGKERSSDPAKQALYDKTNLLLGTYLMDAGKLELARPYFDRVQLEGPFSNRALLGAGWVEARAGRYDRALVPWKLLQSRQTTNEAVQESMLAVPYAYGKLDVHSTAAINYGFALDKFGNEIDTLTDSIVSIREGKFLEALRRKEANQVKNWVVTLRDIPGAPETHYLLDLMASNDYQEFLRNYRDLNDLFERNLSWLQSLTAYEDIIGLRRSYYEPLLPGLDQKFRQLDARIQMRVEERDKFAARIEQMLVTRRPEYLAFAEEQAALAELKQLRSRTRNQVVGEESLRRLERLEGVLQFRLATEYDARLTEAYKHLEQLNVEIEQLQTAYQSYVRSRQAATHSYTGYDDTIRNLRARLNQSQTRLDMLMARQGKMLETLAIDELERRRAQLESYQIKARFALADSYDRANELQEMREDQRKVEALQKAAEIVVEQDSNEVELGVEPGSEDDEQLPQDNPPELDAPAASEPEQEVAQ